METLGPSEVEERKKQTRRKVAQLLLNHAIMEGWPFGFPPSGEEILRMKSEIGHLRKAVLQELREVLSLEKQSKGLKVTKEEIEKEVEWELRRAVEELKREKA